MGVETWDSGDRRREVEELRSLILGIVSSNFVLRDGANTCATIMPCPRASQAGWSTEHATGFRDRYYSESGLQLPKENPTEMAA
jgi:hypothetical protein